MNIPWQRAFQSIYLVQDNLAESLSLLVGEGALNQFTIIIFLAIKEYTPVVLNSRSSGHFWPAGRLFVSPKLLFLHHVFWFDRQVCTGTCLHAKNTQISCYWVTHCASAIFNFHFSFWSISHRHILLAKRKVDSENLQFQEEWRMDLKICIHSPSNKHKTHVLNMPGDYSCDKDFQFETALWGKA